MAPWQGGGGGGCGNANDAHSRKYDKNYCVGGGGVSRSLTRCRIMLQRSTAARVLSVVAVLACCACVHVSYVSSSLPFPMLLSSAATAEHKSQQQSAPSMKWGLFETHPACNTFDWQRGAAAIAAAAERGGRHSGTASGSAGSPVDSGAYDGPMRVYVIELPTRFNVDLAAAYKREFGHSLIHPFDYDAQNAMETLIHASLLHRPHIRTQNAAEADFFFVPFYPVHYYILRKRARKWWWRSIDALWVDLSAHLQSLPHWRRFGGRDHIIPVGHPYAGPCIDCALRRCILLVCDFDTYVDGSNEHDIVIPYAETLPMVATAPITPSPPPPSSSSSASAFKHMQQRQQHAAHHFHSDSTVNRKRPTFLYFEGRSVTEDDTTSLRATLLPGFARFPRTASIVHTDLHRPASQAQASTTARRAAVLRYHNRMLNAQFCLCPRGDTRSSKRVFGAMLAGCIPVIIADGIELPFASLIKYEEFVVVISQRVLVGADAAHGTHVTDVTADTVMARLQSIPDSEVRHRRAAMLRAWQRIRYFPFPLSSSSSLRGASTILRQVDSVALSWWRHDGSVDTTRGPQDDDGTESQADLDNNYAHQRDDGDGDVFMVDTVIDAYVDHIIGTVASSLSHNADDGAVVATDAEDGSLDRLQQLKTSLSPQKRQQQQPQSHQLPDALTMIAYELEGRMDRFDMAVKYCQRAHTQRDDTRGDGHY